MTVVSIHQPNFLPWLGYFVKIARSDIFVFLDNVQFSSGSFCNRVKVRYRDRQVSWLTLPVASDAKSKLINQVEPFKETWRTDVRNRLSDYYARAPRFAAVMPILEKWLIEAPGDNLAALNQQLIINVMDLLRLNAECLVASEMGLGELRLNDLNVAIAKASGADTYLSGTGGAQSFNDAEAYAAEGIRLVYNEALAPAYRQCGDDFIANLSIVDALFNVGAEGTASLIAEAVRSAPPL